MKKLVGFTLVFLLGVGSVQADSPPKPATSKFLKTVEGGFAIRLTRDQIVESCKYSILLAPNQKFEQPLYLKVLFENPLKDKEPLIADVVLKPDMKEVHASSSDVHGLKKGKNYKVMIEIYDSESQTNKLGEHVQLISSGRNVD